MCRVAPADKFSFDHHNRTDGYERLTFLSRNFFCVCIKRIKTGFRHTEERVEKLNKAPYLSSRLKHPLTDTVIE